MKQKILIASILVGLSQFALATVNASVDRSSLSLGQSLTLTIELPSSGDTPNLDGLRQSFDIYGTSSNSQTSIINGKTSSQNTFTANLIPKNPGKQVIPPIQVGNDVTEPIQIEVAATAASVNSPATGQKSTVFVDLSSSAASSYIGTPIMLSVKLYYSVPLSNVSMAPLNLKNAQIQAQGKAVEYQDSVNGKTYQVIEQRFLLTPQQAGELTLPGVRVNGAVNDNSGNDFFSMAIPKPFAVVSKPLVLHVKAIPASIAPNEWLPAKDLELSESWSLNVGELKVGEPLTRTISLQAFGIPASSIPELSFVTPSGVNAYPDKAQAQDSINNNELQASKTFKIAYVPTRAGELQFPEIVVKWWDLASDTLKTAHLAAKSYRVVVDPNAALNNNSASSGTSAASSATLAPALTRTTGQSNPLWIYLTGLFAGLWLLTLVGVLWLLGKKSRTSEPATKLSPVLNSETANEKKLWSLVTRTCQEQNTSQLNKAVIEWASAHWHQSVYSVSEIKALTNDAELAAVIDKLNLSLYRGDEFSDYALLLRLLEQSKLTNEPHKKNPSALQDFYPK